MNGSLGPHAAGGNHRRNAGRPALRYAAAALGAVLLAGCGSALANAPSGGSGAASPRASAPAGGSAPGSPQAASASRGTGSATPTLCRDTATLSSVEIARSPGFRVPEFQGAFPNEVTVTSPPLVRAVARALCGLPTEPRGVLRCPALFVGSSYLLHFAADGRLLPTVTIEATGCRTVTGVGPVRRATSPGLWRALADAIGRTLPGPPVFGGNYPGLPCRFPTARMIKIDACPALARPGTGAAGAAGPAAP